MKIKLDETSVTESGNSSRRPVTTWETVRDEGLSSAGDDVVIKAAGREDRCLVTLDLEFGNPLRYRAADYSGIAVLRLPAKPSFGHLEQAARTLIAELKPTIAAPLIVEAQRIRIYQDPEEDPLDNSFDR